MKKFFKKPLRCKKRKHSEEYIRQMKEQAIEIMSQYDDESKRNHVRTALDITLNP